MKCYLCNGEHPERCKHCLNAGDVNCRGFCRTCQRLFSFPRAWQRVEKGVIVRYGCYFPSTDLNVDEWGKQGTGFPQGVEWMQPETLSNN